MNTKDKIKKWCATTLAIVVLQMFSSPLFGDGYLVLDTGYRYDRINETTEIINSANVNSYASAQQQFKDLQSYQLGARGLYCIPCSSLYVKGAAHYGWELDGGYNNGYVVRGDLRGHTWDATGGIGYLFSVGDCFSWAPLVGFSYDSQHLKVKNSRSDSIAIINDTENLVWHTSWFAPWVGLDIFFESSCCIAFDAGYEFHYGWAHTKFDPAFNDPNNATFDYHTHLNDMVGHVFHLQGLYPFCNNWVLGVRLQYTQWSNNHKVNSVIPSNPAETGLLPTQFQRTTLLSWHSFAATLNLGYSF